MFCTSLEDEKKLREGGVIETLEHFNWLQKRGEDELEPMKTEPEDVDVHIEDIDMEEAEEPAAGGGLMAGLGAMKSALGGLIGYGSPAEVTIDACPLRPHDKKFCSLGRVLYFYHE